MTTYPTNIEDLDSLLLAQVVESREAEQEYMTGFMTGQTLYTTIKQRAEEAGVQFTARLNNLVVEAHQEYMGKINTTAIERRVVLRRFMAAVEEMIPTLPPRRAKAADEGLDRIYIVDDGDMFYGTLEQFNDCFGDHGGDEDLMRKMAANQGSTLLIIDGKILTRNDFDSMQTIEEMEQAIQKQINEHNDRIAKKFFDSN